MTTDELCASLNEIEPKDENERLILKMAKDEIRARAKMSLRMESVIHESIKAFQKLLEK